MTTLQHTPGPWEANDMGLVYSAAVIDEENGAQIVADCDDNSLEADEIIANARLIAAAPELLAALELAEKRMLAFAKERDPGQFGTWHAIFQEARTAIAKAKGETHV